MSEMGETEGFVATASEFRDMFLKDGLKYDSFKCPFCDVALLQKVIYKDSLAGKSPHFSIFPGKNHRHGCNGMPSSHKVKGTRPCFHFRVEKVEMEIPERLVLHHHNYKRRGASHCPTSEPSLEEVRKRRNDPDYKEYIAQYSSQLVRVFVEARTSLLKMCYKIQKKRNLNAQEFDTLVNSILKAYPLILFDRGLTYDNAFRDTARPDLATGMRIFHGKGKVIKKEHGFDLTSDVFAKRMQNGELLESPLPVYVKVQCPHESSALPKPQAETLSQLCRVSDSNSRQTWFAVGEMMYVDSPEPQFVITVGNLYWLYLKTT